MVELAPGLCANLALALQCIAVEVLAAAPPHVRAALMLAAAAAGRETARGQELDAADAADEDGYWRVVEAKTPPLFTAALRMGALSGGAAPAAAEALAAAGIPLGVLVQLGDDLGDVMGEALRPRLAAPGRRTWRCASRSRPTTPSATLPHARSAGAGRPRRACRGARDPVRSGAFGFCVHHMRVAAGEVAAGAGRAPAHHAGAGRSTGSATPWRSCSRRSASTSASWSWPLKRNRSRKLARGCAGNVDTAERPA